MPLHLNPSASKDQSLAYEKFIHVHEKLKQLIQAPHFIEPNKSANTKSISVKNYANHLNLKNKEQNCVTVIVFYSHLDAQHQVSRNTLSQLSIQTYACPIIDNTSFIEFINHTYENRCLILVNDISLLRSGRIAVCTSNRTSLIYELEQLIKIKKPIDFQNTINFVLDTHLKYFYETTGFLAKLIPIYHNNIKNSILNAPSPSEQMPLIFETFRNNISKTEESKTTLTYKTNLMANLDAIIMHIYALNWLEQNKY